MSAQKKKKSSGNAPAAPKGDHEPGLTPPMPFILPKLEDDEKPETVEIMILKDPKKKPTKDNPKKKEFPAVETFTGSCATTVIVLKHMVSTNETFLDYLYCLEMEEDRQEKASHRANTYMANIFPHTKYT